ncbi:AAA family ATPase [Priestia filamentosa]|uniref:McrB family protein n=1 Tax=Priestia filamentosa TaxID=1402861 RepID=UPI0005890396
MYGTEKKEWKTEFAGVLAKQIDNGRRHMFVNKNGAIQFYIKLASTTPDDFPMEVKDVVCFSDAVHAGTVFNDNFKLSDVERMDELQSFLEEYVLFFTVEATSNGDYYRAENFDIVRKDRDFQDGISLESIPIFTKSSGFNQEVFEQRLVNQQTVGENKQISHGKNDAPSMILWKEDDSNFTLYGPFDKHEYIKGEGFKFSPSMSGVKKKPLDVNFLFNSYERENAMFLHVNNLITLQNTLEREGASLFITEHGKDTNKELQFMETFMQVCKEDGMYYAEKDLYNFHTAMKTKGLVILAGMSGTGKSKLVDCYAKALKIGKNNKTMIPVRPSWQDDADLIGYVDTIHQIYRPGDTELIELLVRASTDNENLYIVCFDEMNLARVEHYFSQFLSVLESDGVLRLYNEKHNNLHNTPLFPPNITLGENIMFVGTVNLDESTYHFSDKVLDRANVITLEMQSYANLVEMKQKSLIKQEKNDETNDLENSQEELLTNEFKAKTYNSFKANKDDIFLSKQESELLWSLHLEMQKSNKNLGIGWRIITQINEYLGNLPKNSPLSHKEAFDIQIVQRVLTKIRGTEEQFGELLGSYNLDSREVENSVLLDLLSSLSEYDFKKSIQVIHDKAKELRLYGHTI